MEGLAVAAIDRAEAQRKAQEEQEKQESYAGIVGEGQSFIRDQNTERQALGMDPEAASAFRHEQDMLNQAQRAGIDLTAGQPAEIAQLAQGMAAAEQATTAFAKSQQHAAELSQFFGDTAVDALHGIITGTKTASQSLAEMASALVKMALQASLLNQGPLAGLGRGGGGTGGAAGNGAGQIASILGGSGGSGRGSAGNMLASLLGSGGGGAGAAGGASAGGPLASLLGGGGAALSSALPMIAGALALGAIGKKIGGPFGKIFSLLGGGLGAFSGGLFGFAGGGHIRGPGTGTSDSIPIMASNGEYMVNAKATRRYLPLLDAINSGKAPAFATGGIVGGNFANTYAPSVSVHVGSGQDARVARQIADAVGQALDSRRPDTFRRSDSQQLAQAQTAISRAATRNN